MLTPFLTNLKAGLRASFFLRPIPSESQANWSHLMRVLVLAVAVQLAADAWLVGPAGEWNIAGLSGTAFTMAIVLVAAWTAATVAGKPERTLPFAVVFAVVHLFCSMLFLIVQDGPPLPPATLRYAYIGMISWIALGCGVAAARMVAVRWMRKAWVCALVMVAIGLPMSTIYVSSALWAEPVEEVEGKDLSKHALVREDVFYAQSALLTAALNGVTPAVAGNTIQLFSVLAAGFGEQDVFMKEVKYVNALLDKRFGTAGHSVVLINNTQTLSTHPIASATSLGMSLKRVGEVMDKERDILFLYLSSHGTEDHKFALEFGPMQFNDIDPKRLRKLLDDAGIKRRVVVISACFSGGFVDALKDDNSLIITAAAADRKSFGCSNEADFTYFGKAYFEQAMSRTDSFIEAFELAMPLIASREKEDGYQPSEPRMVVGEAIRPVLAQLAQQRASAHNN
jgi:hypothetical protein